VIFSAKYPTFFHWLSAHPNATTPQATTYEKRIVAGYKKGKQLEAARGHAKILYRHVIGTNFSNKKKPMSFTLYNWLKRMFTPNEQEINFKRFRELCSSYLRRMYPGRDYSYDSAVSDGWLPEEVTREEVNQIIKWEPDRAGKWKFKVMKEHIHIYNEEGKLEYD
jgi:hypothetical protein